MSGNNLNPFNISNDRFYENVHKRERIRQTHGTITLKHSTLALMLAYPFVCALL